MFNKIKIKIKESRKDLVKIEPASASFISHTCKNCDYTFEGNYCPSCGQSVKEVQKPVSHFIGDMFGSLFVLDFRMIKSLPILLFKPGVLSSEYIAGRRMKFVPPFRFFLIASIILFFLLGTLTRKSFETTLDENSRADLADSVLTVLAQRSAEAGLQDTVFPVTNVREGLGFLEIMSRELEKDLEDSTLTPKEIKKTQNRISALKNPNYLTTTIYKYISWSFFILMPFFALILYMFFRKKRKFYVEHLVFSVNLHTFYFILLSIVVALGMIFPSILKGMFIWIFLLAFVYAMVGIRKFYSKRWISSFFFTILTFLLYLLSSLILIIGALVVLI